MAKILTIILLITLSSTAMPLGISDLTLGIIVALIIGCFIFIVKCGKQCCESIIWIRDILKMNLGNVAGEKVGKSNTEFSVEALSREEIVEIKKQISKLSQQARAILAELKQIREKACKEALEDNFKIASTEYAMKFELKRLDFEKAMKILIVTITKIPEEGVVNKEKVIKWIAKAQEKFEDFSPENFSKKVEAVKARRS